MSKSQALIQAALLEALNEGLFTVQATKSGKGKYGKFELKDQPWGKQFATKTGIPMGVSVTCILHDVTPAAEVDAKVAAEKSALQLRIDRAQAKLDGLVTRPFVAAESLKPQPEAAKA